MQTYGSGDYMEMKNPKPGKSGKKISIILRREDVFKAPFQKVRQLFLITSAWLIRAVRTVFLRPMPKYRKTALALTANGTWALAYGWKEAGSAKGKTSDPILTRKS